MNVVWHLGWVTPRVQVVKHSCACQATSRTYTLEALLEICPREKSKHGLRDLASLSVIVLFLVGPGSLVACVTNLDKGLYSYNRTTHTLSPFPTHSVLVQHRRRPIRFTPRSSISLIPPRQSPNYPIEGRVIPLQHTPPDKHTRTSHLAPSSD